MTDDGTTLDIAALVAEHHQAVYRYAYRLTGSVADAEDLTQHVFLTAQQRLGQLRSAGSASSWLFSILRNRFLKNCQKRRPIDAASVRLNVDSIPAEVPEDGLIDGERLQEALGRLPEQYRLVVAMFYYENCSYREIAEKLDVPLGTVMSRLARAKGQLRAQLLEMDPEMGQANGDRMRPPSPSGRGSG
jgi:RNA polymerase sigma-70 factor, ECF subfamily